MPSELGDSFKWNYKSVFLSIVSIFCSKLTHHLRNFLVAHTTGHGRSGFVDEQGRFIQDLDTMSGRSHRLHVVSIKGRQCDRLKDLGAHKSSGSLSHMVLLVPGVVALVLSAPTVAALVVAPPSRLTAIAGKLQVSRWRLPCLDASRLELSLTQGTDGQQNAQSHQLAR